MIIAIDIETKGLDATKYITGCLVKEGKQKPEIYRQPKQLWNRVIELGIKEAKRNKLLNVYSHNAQYDTAGYVDIKDKHLKFFSNNPFIWSYSLSNKEMKQLGIEIPTQTITFTNNIDLDKWKQKNKQRIITEEHRIGNKTIIKYENHSKEIIKFLCTKSLYRGMTLKEVGALIGLPKQETPLELLNENTLITDELLAKIEPYMIQDTKICLQAVLKLKEQLKQNNIHVKRLYTINQIAINYLINELKKQPQRLTEHLFWDIKTGQARRTLRKQEIHNAYRGGRVEAFQTGLHKKVNYIDINSLYPYILANMTIPDLSTERKILQPLEHINPEQLLQKHRHTQGINKKQYKRHRLITNKNKYRKLLSKKRKNTNRYMDKQRTANSNQRRVHNNRHRIQHYIR